MTQLTTPNNSLALASFILGIIAVSIGFLFGIFGYGTDPLRLGIFLFLTSGPSLLAIIFGFIGISTANRLGGKRKGLAIRGIILGFLPLIVFLAARFMHSAIFGG